MAYADTGSSTTFVLATFAIAAAHYWFCVRPVGSGPVGYCPVGYWPCT